MLLIAAAFVDSGDRVLAAEFIFAMLQAISQQKGRLSPPFFTRENSIGHGQGCRLPS
jgi:hypothetical protein